MEIKNYEPKKIIGEHKFDLSDLNIKSIYISGIPGFVRGYGTERQMMHYVITFVCIKKSDCTPQMS